MELLQQPVSSSEFLVVDTETNGLAGESCEMTEVGAVLVGGGELHDRWSSLVHCALPLRRGIQRFTGITQAMVDAAPPPEQVLPEIERELRRRVLVAHNAPFDRRVLRQSFERVGMTWPDPPVLCTASLARVLLPLQNERRLGALADALGIEVRGAHRALADAETCARVLCALFPRLCAHARTVADAIGLQGPRRSRRTRRRSVSRRATGSEQMPDERPATGEPRAQAPGDQTLALDLGASIPNQRALRPAVNVPDRGARQPELDFTTLPRDPGVYLFRDAMGAALYVGKSISIASRARAHFAPAAVAAAVDPSRPDWRAHATIVDYQSTNSELGALVLENRLIKQLRPPGNLRLNGQDDRLVYIRCRLDIPYPILEVASEPAAGHAVSIGPLRGRRLALEVVEQLDSLFGLRHCGRRLVRRQHPSAYGQMGRCLSPCLGDLDPNLYRRRLDEALRLFVDGGDARERLLAHVEGQMHEAATAQRFERAISLRRRAGRLRAIFKRLGGVLEATHARPRLVLARHPNQPRQDAFWLVAGRLVDWGAATDAPELQRRTHQALASAGRPGELGAHVPPEEVDEVRILASYLASHPDTTRLDLETEPDLPVLERLLAKPN